MDNRNREIVFSAPNDPDDGDEYELDLPDPTIVSAEERHAKQVAQQVRASIDIDEVYREAERDVGTEILERWMGNFRLRFQFQVKHLLIATAVLAIALTLAKLGLLWSTIAYLLIFGIIGLYAYVRWEEQKHQAEVAQKREELYARRRENLTAVIASQAGGAPVAPTLPPSIALPPVPNDFFDDPAPAKPEPIRLHYSMRELLIAMTPAAVLFGVIRFLGPAPTATILGLVALSGLIVYAVGYQPPKPVVLGWWLILVLYVFVSLLGAVWMAFT
jgi:hypothetical protein